MATTTLVTFATPQLRLRQIALGISAKSIPGLRRVENWNVRRLKASGFPEAFSELSLSDRGAGYWAWKPFIIGEALAAVNDGDLVMYCDVGRIYPWKLLHHHIDCLVEWMDERGQDLFPGVQIPWFGPMEKWTKRYAFEKTGTDSQRYHEVSPVQASFSIWRKTPETVALARDWAELCQQRKLVSDDVVEGSENLPKYVEHRHDQSLWSLLCYKQNIQAFDPAVDGEQPGYDEKNPAEIARVLGGKPARLPAWLTLGVSLATRVEKALR